ncbi:BING4 C-terminal domain [Trinorchestia longiramus]|nr:BING4 C-terminal domain [Trinorchestia longiramus]
MADTVAGSLDLIKVSKQNNRPRKRADVQKNIRGQVKEKYPDRKPLDPTLKDKYDFGPGMDAVPKLARDKFRRFKVKQHERFIQQGQEQTARAEILLTEQSGCIEVGAGSATTDVTQKNILQFADITTKKKSFNLHLDDFGPYRFQYFRDGRHLAMAGQLGHLATMNWVTKKLTMELNAMESLHDVAWLQDTTALAVAQKKWTSIYDDRGTELHVVKRFFNITKLDYLPYHFLLTGLSEEGNLHYLDVSLGKEVLFIKPKQTRAVAMVNSPYNGVMTTAHGGGVVCMWTPNHNEPVGTVLCHKSNISSIAYDPAGRYMLTAGYDRKLNIWDARNLGTQLQSLSLPRGVVNSMSVSQTGLVAVSCARDVSIYRGLKEGNMVPYLHHPLETKVHQVQFCPYEDVLGISSVTGFSSIIIPGAGEANFDAYEANPFSNRTTRRETLVKNLLEKIPYQHITLDPRTVAQVDVPSLEEKMEEKRRLIFMKVPKIDPNPRYRMKGKSGSTQMARRKYIKREVFKKRYIDKLKRARTNAGLDDVQAQGKDEKKKKNTQTAQNMLDIFKKNKK